jgi:hypothetical protein
MAQLLHQQFASEAGAHKRELLEGGDQIGVGFAEEGAGLRLDLGAIETGFQCVKGAASTILCEIAVAIEQKHDATIPLPKLFEQGLVGGCQRQHRRMTERRADSEFGGTRIEAEIAGVGPLHRHLALGLFLDTARIEAECASHRTGLTRPTRGEAIGQPGQFAEPAVAIGHVIGDFRRACHRADSRSVACARLILGHHHAPDARAQRAHMRAS